jgi:hypothetical protein
MESPKELQTVVEFYRAFLKQPENSDSEIVENYIACWLDRLVLFNSPPGASHREIMVYRSRLMDFIRS